MKLYKNLVNSLAQILQDVFLNGRYADKAIERAFKQNAQWGSRDRRFIAEGVYDIVRYYRLYASLAESENNFWFMVACWLVTKDVEIPDWPEFKHVNPALVKERKKELSQNVVVRESYPDWLWERGVTELGKNTWGEQAIALNKQAEVYLRVNSLKCNREDALKKLLEENIAGDITPEIPECIKLQKRENIFRSKLFRDGMIEVQDGGSQQIAHFLDPKSGDVILDACAGAGGKSLHLAALMKNKGKIISMDVEDWKLEELKKRARRAGAFNIETRLGSKNPTIKGLEGKADKVLLDVPCSGSGVLKRNPDAKWKLSNEGINEIIQVQRSILNEYSKAVRKGGILVYSTCSIFPSENKKQVTDFLESHSEFKLECEKIILPSGSFDGFYMAKMNLMKE
jgi:16S rRNA (cytosine967-C5)-methyltransferase